MAGQPEQCTVDEVAAISEDERLAADDRDDRNAHRISHISIKAGRYKVPWRCNRCRRAQSLQPKPRAPFLAGAVIPWWINRGEFRPAFSELGLMGAIGVLRIVAGVSSVVDSFAITKNSAEPTTAVILRITPPYPISPRPSSNGRVGQSRKRTL